MRAARSLRSLHETEGEDGEGVAESAESPAFLVVRCAGQVSMNGRYFQEGVFQGRPKYKQVSGQGIIYFKYGGWKLNDEDDTGGWCYEAAQDSSMPPMRAWSTAVSRYGTAPSLCLGTCQDIEEGDSVTIVKADSQVDWSDCPEESVGQRLTFANPPWSLVVHRLVGDAETGSSEGAAGALRRWFYSTEYETLVAPLAALGFVDFHGIKHRISSSDRDEGSTAVDPPFLVVSGAGHPPVNGRYAQEGLFSGRPKYKQLGGNSIIFFTAGKWRLNDEEVTDERCYDGEGDAAMPPREWLQFHTRFGTVPSLSLGTFRDLQEGDQVFIEREEDVDWSGFPEDRQRFRFRDFPCHLTVGRIQGDWFVPEPGSGSVPLRAVRSVRLRGVKHRISEGELAQEILVQGAGGSFSEANGFYRHHGEHNGKVIYQKAEDRSMGAVYFDAQWKIGLHGVEDWVYCHPDESLSQPPSSRWRGSEASEEGSGSVSICSVPQVLVVANGSPMMNGRYARAEDLNGKPKFRQVGGSSVLQFEDGWKMKGAEMSEHSYYHPDDVALPPTGDWSAVGGGESPRVSLLHSPISSAPRFFWVQGAGGVGEQTNGCYVCIGSSNGKPKYWQMDGAGIIYFRGTWRINYRDQEGGWYYQHPTRADLPPSRGWTTEGYSGRGDPAPSLEPQARYSSEGFQQPHPPFVVVRGAGHPPVNGRYANVGFHEGKPKYKQVEGESIIFFEADLWRLNDEENTRQRKYDGPSSGAERNGVTPPREWVAFNSRYGSAPTLSFGSSRDLREGDVVTIVKDDTEVDWSGCPEDGEDSEGSRLSFRPPWTVTVQRIVSGAWFYPTLFPQLVAPLSAVGLVSLAGKMHRVAEAQEASGGANGSVDEPEVTGGYDEEWFSEQEVERFRCPICFLVARDAMAHDCGAVLFCETCWVKCMAEDSKCSVCRKDGSTVAPAHFERRAIRNLLVKCPNGCGENFQLYDKEKHLKESCSARQVKCEACEGFYQAGCQEEHRKACGARWSTCRLCGEQVQLSELEAHYASNPGKHISQIVALLDEVSRLREEVKQLKGES